MYFLSLLIDLMASLLNKNINIFFPLTIHLLMVMHHVFHKYIKKQKLFSTLIKDKKCFLTGIMLEIHICHYGNKLHLKKYSNRFSYLKCYQYFKIFSVFLSNKCSLAEQKRLRIKKHKKRNYCKLLATINCYMYIYCRCTKCNYYFNGSTIKIHKSL